MHNSTELFTQFIFNPKTVALDKAKGKDGSLLTFTSVDSTSGKPIKSSLKLQKVKKDVSKLNQERYLGGGRGTVKVGTENQTRYAVKIFKLNEQSLAERIICAQNDAKFNLLLGRPTRWGVRNKKAYVRMPWITGDSLRNYYAYLKKCHSSSPPPSSSIPSDCQLLSMFKNYLRQAKVFHDFNLIVGDPKPENAMVDTAQGTIEMVDFDAVHPVGAPNSTHPLWIYLPPNLKGLEYQNKLAQYTQADDIYIFGIMLAKLFPQYMQVELGEDRTAQITFKKTEHNEGLQNLVLQMTNRDPKWRPDIQECLRQVSKLLQAANERHEEMKVEPLIEPPEYTKDDHAQHTCTQRALSIVKTFFNPFLDKIRHDSKEEEMRILELEAKKKQIKTQRSQLFDSLSQMIEKLNRCYYAISFVGKEEDQDEYNRLSALLERYREECRHITFNSQDTALFSRIQAEIQPEGNTAQALNSLIAKNNIFYSESTQLILTVMLKDLDARISKYQACYKFSRSTKTHHKITTAHRLQSSLKELQEKITSPTNPLIENQSSPVHALINQAKGANQAYTQACQAYVFWGKTFSKNDQQATESLQCGIDGILTNFSHMSF